MKPPPYQAPAVLSQIQLKVTIQVQFTPEDNRRDEFVIAIDTFSLPNRIRQVKRKSELFALEWLGR